MLQPLPLPSSISTAPTHEAQLPRLAAPLTSTHAALANALLLLSHPFVVHHHSGRRRWTINKLRSELIGTPRSTRRRTKHGGGFASSSSSCTAQAHAFDANGTAQYSVGSLRVSCSSMLRSLASRTTSPAYYVVDSMEGAATSTVARCLPTLRELGTVIGELHGVIDRVTAGQGVAAQTNLRVGATDANASAYPLHYDSTDNFLMQLQGSKLITLAPPSQLPSLAREHGKVLQDERHFPSLDLRTATGTSMPGFKALRVRLQEGDALFIPRRWLHYVHGTAPNPRAPLALAVNSFFTDAMPRWLYLDDCAHSGVDFPAAYKALFYTILNVDRVREAYCADALPA